jgi:signal transduction histidine kinase
MEGIRIPKRLSPARRLAYTFGPTLVVVLFGLLAAWGALRERRSREAVTLSNRIIATGNELLVRVTDGETGQRGYLLTGQRAYLEPYLRAQADAATLSARLRTMTRDPAQVARADSLQGLVGAKFEELAETVEIHDTRGAAAALAVVRTGRGQARMNEIRRVAVALERREHALLAERARREEAFSRTLLLILVVGTVSAGALSLALNTVVARYAGTLTRVNAELEGANGLLEEQQVELEHQNEQLQEQSVELEAQALELELQNERLSETATELERRSEAAEAANVAKARFLASMSHDLRTPLNAILGYVDLLDAGVRGPVNEAQTADLVRIRGSGRHLLMLINDILSYARMEAGKVEIRLQPVPLEATLHDMESSFLPQMQARGLEYAYLPPSRPLHVLADPDKVEQVLLNLVTNAIKFTEPGGTVSLSCGEEAGLVVVQVRDTGRGIPADKLPTVFEPFVQVDRERTDAANQGVGLGLAISRELARAMGGDLRVESVVGQGSTFTLRLRPAAAPEEADGRASADRRFAPAAVGPRDGSPEIPPPGEPPGSVDAGAVPAVPA